MCMYITPTYVQYIYTFWDTYTYAHAGSLMDSHKEVSLVYFSTFEVDDFGVCEGLFEALDGSVSGVRLWFSAARASTVD